MYLFTYCIYLNFVFIYIIYYILFYIVKIIPIEDTKLLKCKEQELKKSHQTTSQIMLKCVIFSLFSMLIGVCSTHFYLKTQYIVYLFYILLVSSFV